MALERDSEILWGDIAGNIESLSAGLLGALAAILPKMAESLGFQAREGPRMWCYIIRILGKKKGKPESFPFHS